MMNAADLRALQAPLKQSYRDNPAAARIPARAVGRIEPGRIACHIDKPHGTITAGLHAAAGGDGTLACSGDMLLEALIACAGVTLSAVATAMGVSLAGGTITAEAVWDARGTLAIDRSAPVGITDLMLRFDLDTTADAATLERLIATTERYCVILQTLRNPPVVTTVLA